MCRNYEELEAIRAEMAVREQEIAELEEDKAAVEAQKRAINEELDIQAYLGEELWKVLYSYRREQTYSNDNYISDGLDSSEVIEKAREFFTAAQKELITASTVQYSLSCSMYNLLVRPEFQALWSKFKLGNWLRMKINHEIHRMRLVQFQVNFERIETLTVEFSDAHAPAMALMTCKASWTKRRAWLRHTSMSRIRQAKAPKPIRFLRTGSKMDWI